MTSCACFQRALFLLENNKSKLFVSFYCRHLPLQQSGWCDGLESVLALCRAALGRPERSLMGDGGTGKSAGKAPSSVLLCGRE